MRPLTQSDALRLFLIATLGLPASFACGESATSGGGDGDGDGDGDVGDGDGDSGDGDSGDGDSGDGDSGDGDGDSGDGDGDGDVIVPASTCTNPTPRVAGEDTGFVNCDEGYIHRESREACPSVLPRDNEVTLPDYGYGGAIELVDECETDSDCTGPLEYCASTGSGFDGLPARECLTSCVTDSDCGDGYVCLCGPQFGQCEPGTIYNEPGSCETDADCSGEELCVGVFFSGACGPGHYQFSCTPFFDAECATEDASCYDEYECSMQNGQIVCQPNVVCGRPFLVEAEDRKAELACRDDWCAPCVSMSQRGPMSEYEASAGEREIAAAYFEKIALMEHASIAAFARFSLQLLSLGAPASFIEETNQALFDETKHARLAFALASRFGGRRVGPGALPIHGALGEDCPEAILTTTILEGCVGETMAALEARAALELCVDEEVRAAFEQIAADEERHAALAWKVVSWMIEERPELRSVAEGVFAQAVSRRATSLGRRAGAPALGVLSGEALARVHADALDNVVIPCARGLFAPRGPVERAGATATDGPDRAFA